MPLHRERIVNNEEIGLIGRMEDVAFYMKKEREIGERVNVGEWENRGEKERERERERKRENLKYLQ